MVANLAYGLKKSVLARTIVLSFIMSTFLFMSSLYAQTPLSGTYTVGVDGNYPSLKDAASALLSEGISGDINFEIISDLNESEPAVFESWGSNFTVKIYPSGSSRTITCYSQNSGVIILNGVSNMVIDGSIGSGGNDRSLIIRNSYDSPGQAGIWLKSLSMGQGVQNSIIKNCQIFCSAVLSDEGSYGIMISGASFGSNSESYSHSGITIENNEILHSYTGIYAVGTSDSKISGLSITGNSVGSSWDYDNDGVYQYGIYIENATGSTIISNSFYEIRNFGIYLTGSDAFTINSNYLAGTNVGSFTGIFNSASSDITISNNVVEGFANAGICVEAVSASNYYGNTITNANSSSQEVIGLKIGDGTNNCKFDRNIIKEIYSTSGELNTRVVGIYMAGSGSMNNVITNTIVRNLGLSSTTSAPENGLYGIVIDGQTNVSLVNNTIRLNGYFSGNGEGYSACLNILSPNSTNIIVKNNIFINAMAGSADNSKAFALITADYNNFAADGLNYNIYDISTANNGILSFVIADNKEFAAISDWRTATSQDNATYAKSIQFLASDNSHIDGSSITDEELMAPAYSDASVDMDGIVRKSETTRGADEVFIQSYSMTKDISISPDTRIFCSDNADNSATFSMLAEVSGFEDGVYRNIASDISYNWYRNEEIIQSSNDNNLNLSPVNDFNTGAYRCEAILGNTTLKSGEISIIYQSPLKLTRDITSYLEISNTTPLKLETVVTGTINKMQWFKYNASTSIFEEIPGMNTPVLDLEVESIPENLNGEYIFRTYGPGNCGAAMLSSTSCVVKVVYPLVNYSAGNADNEVVSSIVLCNGESLTMTAKSEGTVYGYQWQKMKDGEFEDITLSENSSAQSSVFFIESTQIWHTTAYRCKIIGSNVIGAGYVNTNEINVKINTNFSFSQQPKSEMQCFNSKVVINVSAKGEILGYQWYKDGHAITIEENINSNKSQYMIESLSWGDVGNYYCELTINDCAGVRKVNSESAIVYTLSKTEITREPQDRFALEGQVAHLGLEAHIKGIVPPFYQHEYQWYRYTNGTSVKLVDGDRIEGGHSPEISIRNLSAADFTDILNSEDYYYCVVTGLCGTATTRPVKLILGPGVNILTHPADLTGCEQTNAEFNVAAEIVGSGTELNYQWTINGQNFTDDANVSGSNSSKLVINKLEKWMEGKILCVVNVLPGTLVLKSLSADLIVNLAPVITSIPSIITIEENKTISIEPVIANVLNAKYQWLKDGNTIDLATTPIYTLPLVQLSDAGIYTVEVTNDCGKVTSQNVTLVVTPAPITGITENCNGLLLYSVVPNPVSNSASIRFETQTETNVKLTLADGMGRELAVLFNGMSVKGMNEVNINTIESNLNSGVYYYTVTSGKFTTTRMMVVVK